MGPLLLSMSPSTLLSLLSISLTVSYVSANCRTCRCNVKTEDGVTSKAGGLIAWNKNICSSGRKTFLGKIFGHISCEKAGKDCPGHCLGWARGRVETQGLSLYSHSKVDCGVGSEKHSALNVRVCC